MKHPSTVVHLIFTGPKSGFSPTIEVYFEFPLNFLNWYDAALETPHVRIISLFGVPIIAFLDMLLNLQFQFSSLHSSWSNGVTAMISDIKRFFSVFSLPFYLLALWLFALVWVPSFSPMVDTCVIQSSLWTSSTIYYFLVSHLWISAFPSLHLPDDFGQYSLPC